MHSAKRHVALWKALVSESKIALTIAVVQSSFSCWVFRYHPNLKLGVVLDAPTT